MAPGVFFSHLTPAMFLWWHLVMFHVIMTEILWDISSSYMDREWSVSLWIFQKNIYMYWQHLFEKLGETETHRLDLGQYNTRPMHSKSNIDHSSKRGPATFFHTDDNPALGHFVVHSADKTHGLVSVLSLNFVPTLNISLSFRRFRRSYVNHPVVVPTRYCQSCTAYA